MYRPLLTACIFTALGLTGCDDSFSIATTTNTGEVAAGSGSGVVVAGSSTGTSTGTTTGATTSSGASSGLSLSANSDLATDDTDAYAPLALSSGVTADCSGFITATPRGMSCIHCLHENATEQADELVDILASTCLENVALSYLVDGSFGTDYAKIVQHVETLVNAGRRVFVHVYLLNGPSQRKWKSTPVRGTFTTVSPENFRRRIGSDQIYRAKVRELVWDVLPTLSEIAGMGAEISLVPMLEDNLTEESFEQLAEIIMEEIPTDLPISFGRNPCPGCYSGNDSSVPSGFFTEVHSKATSSMKVDGVYSNDGHDVSFNGQELGNRVISLSALARLRDASARKNTLFLFWNAEFQGLRGENGSVSGTGVDPDDRYYAFPTRTERSKLVSFLNGRPSAME